jgi:tetratricopeptide (TPR) repeat protein
MEGFGFYHFRRGAFDGAKTWFERAIQSGSRSFLSYYFVSRIEKSGGDVRAPAVGDALRKAIELASHLTARKERLEEALALAMRATELDPDNAWTWVNLGLVYVVVGDPDEARKAGRSDCENPARARGCPRAATDGLGARPLAPRLSTLARQRSPLN